MSARSIFRQYLSGMPKELTDSLDNNAITPAYPVLSKIYVRNDGSDDNDGASPATALRTLKELHNRVIQNPKADTRQVFDLTGFVDSDSSIELFLDFRGPWKQQFELSRPGGKEDAKFDVNDFPFEFRADPTLVQSLNFVSTSTDSSTGLSVVTVSETLVVNAHIGQFVWSNEPTFGYVYGQILSNTANTITMSTTWGASAFDGNTGGIYAQSCTLDYKLLYISSDCPIAFHGIKFLNTAAGGGSAIQLYLECNDPWLRACSFDGIYSGDGHTHLSDCYFDGGHCDMETSFEVYTCCFKGVDLSCHGSTGAGLNYMYGSIFDSCSPIGAGNLESAVDIQVTNCWIKNATSIGIQKWSPYSCSVNTVKIENCASHGIQLYAQGGFVKLQKVVGTGNGGYGVSILNGAQARSDENNTITGSSGDIQLGDTTATWAAVDALTTGQSLTDAAALYPHFSRVFT